MSASFDSPGTPFGGLERTGDVRSWTRWIPPLCGSRAFVSAGCVPQRCIFAMGREGDRKEKRRAHPSIPRLPGPCSCSGIISRAPPQAEGGRAWIPAPSKGFCRRPRDSLLFCSPPAAPLTMAGPAAPFRGSEGRAPSPHGRAGGRRGSSPEALAFFLLAGELGRRGPVRPQQLLLRQHRRHLANSSRHKE